MEVAHQQLMDVLMPQTAARRADERHKQQDSEAAVSARRTPAHSHPHPHPNLHPTCSFALTLALT